MDFVEYQRDAMRTRGELHGKGQLIAGGLGIAGEAGEVADTLKKHLFHGHDLNKTTLLKELGDVLWYITLLADAIGVELEDVAEANIVKLKERYPNGFNSDASINRGNK